MANYKKINVVSQFWPPSFVGGGEISTFIICQELSKRGYDVTILTPNPPLGKGSKFKYVKLFNPSSLLKPFEKNYFSQISLRGDLPEGIYWASDYYGAAYLYTKNVKKIVTVRDHWPICITSLNLLEDYSACDGCNIRNITKHYGMEQANLYKKLSRCCSMIYNLTFRRSILSSFDHVIYISDYIANKICASIHLRDYSIIHNPLTRHYIENNFIKTPLNKQILFTGFIKEFKGMNVLLEAMKILTQKDQAFHLTVVGYGDIEKYTRISKTLGIEKNVRFTGKLDMEHIIQKYRSSTVIVVPSLCFETFCRTVIEGMSQECIVIATDRGGPAEIIKHGQSGYLCAVNDHIQLAATIRSLYDDTKKMREIQENARKYAMRNFPPEKICNRYESILEKFF